MDTILIKQAENFFKDSKSVLYCFSQICSHSPPPPPPPRYQEAAISFSQSQLSFEEVALKFIQVDRADALKTFLIKKLASLHKEVRGCDKEVWLWSGEVRSLAAERGGLVPGYREKGVTKGVALV